MTKGLNVDDIAHDVHRDLHHLGLTKGASEEILRGVFAAIKQRVASGEAVNVRGFGVFEAKLFKGRTLNSPLVKGGSIDFGDQLVLRFRQSPAAKREINEIANAKGKKAAKTAAKDKPVKGGKAKAAPEAEPEAEAAEAEAKPAKAAKKGEAAKPAKKGAAKKAAKTAEA